MSNEYIGTVFGEEGRKFVKAITNPSTKARSTAVQDWIRQTTPIIQAAVERELSAYANVYLKLMETEKGWAQQEEKLRSSLRLDYHLVMEIKLKHIQAGQRYFGVLPKKTASRTEIDLHGMDLAEALLAVRNFLESAYADHEAQVLIIHGKGEGILREAVRGMLPDHPLVQDFSAADAANGGEEGATMVKLREWVYN